jgi:hypothetical protein
VRVLARTLSTSPWLLFLVLACAGCVTTSPRQTRLSSARVEVTLDTTYAVPIVTTVTINGRGPYRFALDTGCGAVFISQALARELELPAVPGGAEVVASTGDRLPPRRKVRVASLGIGGAGGGGGATAEFRDFAAVVDPLTPAAEARIDGFLGLSAFRDCVLTLDIGRNRAAVSSRRLDPASPGAIPLAIRDTVPVVPVIVRPGSADETRLELVLDSGGEDALCLPRRFYPDGLALEPTGQKALVWSLAGQREELLYRSPSTFLVGPLRFDGVGDISRTDGDGFVGTGLLRQMVVSIDQRADVVKMTRPSGKKMKNSS